MTVIVDTDQVLEHIIKPNIKHVKTVSKQDTTGLLQFREAEIGTAGFMLSLRPFIQSKTEYHQLMDKLQELTSLGVEQLAVSLSMLADLMTILVNIGTKCDGREVGEVYDQLVRMVMLYLMAIKDYVLERVQQMPDINCESIMLDSMFRGQVKTHI